MATKGSPAPFSAASTTGWRPPSILNASEESTSGPGPVALDGELRERGGDVDIGDRRAEGSKALAFGKTGVAQPLEGVELERQRPVGGRGDPRLELDERVGGEAQRPGHGLAVDEGRVEGGLEQRLALRLRRLDVVAEEVVVPDLELPDARLLDIGRLHLGDHPPALVAERARLVERRQAARADEAASRFTSGRSSASVFARSSCNAAQSPLSAA